VPAWRLCAPLGVLGPFLPCSSSSRTRIATPPGGYLAFTGPATSRLLLLTDAGHDAVHVIDVVERVHVGYVAAPGTIDGQFYRPYGLRFTGDGAGLAVAGRWNHRVSVFRVEDGSFARHVATELAGPLDVEECEGGWLVACARSDTIEFVGGGVCDGGVCGASLGEMGNNDGQFMEPSALALVPGLGLVVRDCSSLQFFATPDVIAMASMSACRTAWLGAVARCVVARSSTAKPAPAPHPAPGRSKRSRRHPAAGASGAL
jgi:hypothetical protein